MEIERGAAIDRGSGEGVFDGGEGVFDGGSRCLGDLSWDVYGDSICNVGDSICNVFGGVKLRGTEGPAHFDGE
jgi:hypothetical protein